MGSNNSKKNERLSRPRDYIHRNSQKVDRNTITTCLTSVRQGFSPPRSKTTLEIQSFSEKPRKNVEVVKRNMDKSKCYCDSTGLNNRGNNFVMIRKQNINDFITEPRQTGIDDVTPDQQGSGSRIIHANHGKDFNMGDTPSEGNTRISGWEDEPSQEKLTPRRKSNTKGYKYDKSWSTMSYKPQESIYGHFNQSREEFPQETIATTIELGPLKRDHMNTSNIKSELYQQGILNSESTLSENKDIIRELRQTGIITRAIDAVPLNFESSKHFRLPPIISGDNEQFTNQRLSESCSMDELDDVTEGDANNPADTHLPEYSSTDRLLKVVDIDLL